MNQGKLEVVKQDMARVNIDILGIGELKWTGMCEFSPVAYWAPTDLGSSSLSVLSFCLFILFMGFSRQEY